MGNTLAGGSFPSEGTIGWDFGFPDPGLRRIKIVIAFQSVSSGNLSARFRLSVGAAEYTDYKKSEYSPGSIPPNTSKIIYAPEGLKVYRPGGIVYLKDNGAPLPDVFLRAKERWKLAFFNTAHSSGTSIQVGQDRYRAYKVTFGTGGTAESKMYLGEALHITSRASDFGL